MGQVHSGILDFSFRLILHILTSRTSVYVSDPEVIFDFSCFFLPPVKAKIDSLLPASEYIPNPLTSSF